MRTSAQMAQECKTIAQSGEKPGQGQDDITSEIQGRRSESSRHSFKEARRFDACKIAVSHGPKNPANRLARDVRLPCTRCIAAATRSHENGFADRTIGLTCIPETLGTS